MKNELLKPFIKWVGGKRQLMDEINKRIPNFSGKYYEPFVGGGALFFNLQRSNVLINDFNEELINTYTTIRDNLDDLIIDLEKHDNSAEYFYQIRSIDRDENYSELSNVERASRFLYLNKTCFNGLYRVNSKGYFNTPYGKYKNPNYKNYDVLSAVSEYLNKANIAIKNVDFEESVKYARKGSFVYFDPPYDPISDTSSFTGYVSGGFDRSDQIRLKKLCDRLDKKGVKFMVSNSDTDFIKDLYKDYNIDIVEASRFINANGANRGKVGEVLITNYKEIFELEEILSESEVFYKDESSILYKGDSTELLDKIEDKSIDLIFADPPYFLSNGGITCASGKMVNVDKGDWDKETSFETKHIFNRGWISKCKRVLKDNGSIFISGTFHNIYSVGVALEQEGFQILNNITWEKTNPPPNLACRYFTHSTENIVWARKKGYKVKHKYNYSLMKERNDNKQRKDVWMGSTTKKSEKIHGRHPTQKPEYLLEEIILAASCENDVILDPFVGSGTTVAVAKKLKRKSIGIDLEEDYLNISKKRLMEI